MTFDPMGYLVTGVVQSRALTTSQIVISFSLKGQNIKVECLPVLLFIAHSSDHDVQEIPE